VQRPIVLLSPLLPPMKGGLADHSWYLAKNLSKGNPVAVLSSRDVYTDAPFPIRATIHDWEDPGELALELGALPSDAILMWQYVPHMYGRGGVNRKLAELWRYMRQEGRKQVMIAHEIAAPWGRWPNQWWYAWNHRKQWRAILELADLVPISTEAWTLDWQRRAPGAARKMLTLPSPTSIERVTVDAGHRAEWRAQQGLPADAKVLLWWGTVSGAKQLMWVVDAWETACARLGPVVLCIVGGNPAVSLPGSMRPWSRILGYLKSSEVSRCLHAADVVALPFVDGVSERRTTLMAALDHGVAVAGTWGHNTGPTLKKGGFVSLSPAAEGEAFIENVVNLLRDDGERARVARAGKEWHDAHYGWPVVTEQLVGAMREANLLQVVPLPKR
jgi:glycosyltransferase involved in cell wall biosynthesis